MTFPKIAIIGAGPAGCMLGRILSVSNIPVTIYESDESPDSRSHQGGPLNLHPKTALAALKEARLWDEFMKIARFDGDYHLLSDKNLNPFIRTGLSNKDNEIPEIDHAQLRQILLGSLPEGTIKWGHRLQRVEDGGRLVFEHTTIAGFDLIVGCEGGWSKVRSYIAPTVKPHYTGIGYHRLSIPDAQKIAPNLYGIINHGSVVASANGQRLSVQQMSNGSLDVGWATVRPESWTQTCRYNPHNLDQVKKAILDDMHDWCPQLREAIYKAQGTCEPKNIYMLPIGWRWEHHRGVTIIGDAAHLMTPFSGEGVNVAFDDARKLAAAIAGAVGKGGKSDDLDKQVHAFEKGMFPRMEVYQQRTDEITRLWLFTEGDLTTIVPKVVIAHRLMKLAMPSVLVPLASGLVRSWWSMKDIFGS
ncbi:hypothetical protein F4779DRAFT_442358 [Xylariaceae sp. FL0662B]|nr:hypothetical protein F4779DRAFT_442358 [Xylariaceae sp. FL0662B]